MNGGKDSGRKTYRSEPRKPNPIDVHVGGRMRRRRQEIGLQIEALADMLGLAYQQVHKYETGENRISASRLYEGSRILSVPITWFYEDIRPSEAAPAPGGEQPPVPASPSGSSPSEWVRLLQLFQRIDDPRRRKMLLEMAALIADERESER